MIETLEEIRKRSGFAKTPSFRAGNPDAPGLGSPVPTVAPAAPQPMPAGQPAFAAVQPGMIQSAGTVPFTGMSTVLPSSNAVQYQRDPGFFVKGQEAPGYTPYGSFNAYPEAQREVWMPYTTGNFRDQTFAPYAEIPDYMKQEALDAFNKGFTQEATNTSGMQTLQEYDQWFSNLFNRTKNAQFIGNKVRSDYYEKYMPQKVAEQYRAEKAMKDTMAAAESGNAILNKLGLGESHMIGPDGKPMERPGYKEQQSRKSAQAAGLIAPDEQPGIVRKDFAQREPAMADALGIKDETVVDKAEKPYIWIDGKGMVDNPKYTIQAQKAKEAAEYDGIGNQRFAKQGQAVKKHIIARYQKLAEDASLLDAIDPRTGKPIAIIDEKVRAKAISARRELENLDAIYDLAPSLLGVPMNKPKGKAAAPAAPRAPVEPDLQLTEEEKRRLMGGKAPQKPKENSKE